VPNVLGRKQCASKNQILHVEKVLEPDTIATIPAHAGKLVIGLAEHGNKKES